MKSIKYLAVALLVFIYTNTNAQHTDSSTVFKVFGNCEQCKTRIEKAAKMKGVKNAVWDVDSKLLSLTYDTAKVSLNAIQARIVSVGHDLENKKAASNVYDKLPSCCKYREEETDMKAQPVINEKADTANLRSVVPDKEILNIVRGVVLESNKSGNFKPLVAANVLWLETGQGVITDDQGIFKINKNDKTHHLVVSFAGYSSDTLFVNNDKELKIILASDKKLAEVTVTSKQRSSYVALLNPVRTQIITEKELFKAACCNLSESFETNPSVDVSYNDAVTGSKQIQLLGLSGNYTQLTIENLPGPRGIATPWGFNSIAGPWVESIQLTKGIGSVANGFESIAGQINVELKKPETMEKLYANVYLNDLGKTDVNLNLSKKINNNWSTALLLHGDDFSNKKLDENKDGFRDQPTGNQVSFINRWKYADKKGYMVQFGIKYMNDDKTGGQVNFEPSKDKFTDNNYGLGIKASRKEAFAKIGYVFPEKKYKSIGLQLSAFEHDQNSYFGFTKYDATQQSYYSNLIYQSIIGTTDHKFRTGLSFISDKYNENFNITNYHRTENVPGAFFEYTYSHLTKFTVVAGIRADHNNLYGWFSTPRLHIRYEPVKGTTIRISAGRGQRTANIFSENTSVFVSARKLTLNTNANDKAYGLNPEVAWNKGISIDQKLNLFHRTATLSVDYFRNDFVNQVVVNLENPELVQFADLSGKSYSNSVQAELDLEPVKKLELRLAYRYFDVKTTYDGKLLQRPLVASDRAFLNAAYSYRKFKFDYTLSYSGKKRIPNTSSLPAEYRLGEYSPSYFLMNAQLSKTVGKKHPVDLYFGAENLTDYYQKNTIMSASNPFGKYFDASMVWGPVSGRMFYLGCRFKLI
jgi:outer membrane receptor for ferrienterochelin and colicins